MIFFITIILLGEIDSPKYTLLGIEFDPPGLNLNQGLGYSLAIGDLNGDGYNDLAVGRPNFSMTYGALAGSVFVYFGSPVFETHAPDLVLSAGIAGDQFGFCVEMIGDINGDGLPELAVGAPGITSVYRQKVYIYYSGDPFDTQPDIIFSTPDDDFERFGMAITAEDFYGDGKIDIVISDPFYPRIVEGPEKNHGRVYIFWDYNPANCTRLDPPNIGSDDKVYYGWSLAAEDLRFEDPLMPELIIGCPSGHRIGALPGYVHIIDGATGSQTFLEAPDGAGDNSWFGAEVLASIDICQDGTKDLIVGAPKAWGNTGRVYICNRTAPSNNFEITDELRGEIGNGFFGSSLANGGDANSDGKDDLLIGEPHYWYKFYYGLGVVKLYFGDVPGGMHHALPDILFPHPNYADELSHEGLGFSITVGDLDGDGDLEYGFGAPGGNDPYSDRKKIGEFQIYGNYNPRSLIDSATATNQRNLIIEGWYFTCWDGGDVIFNGHARDFHNLGWMYKLGLTSGSLPAITEVGGNPYIAYNQAGDIWIIRPDENGPLGRFKRIPIHTGLEAGPPSIAHSVYALSDSIFIVYPLYDGALQQRVDLAVLHEDDDEVAYYEIVQPNDPFWKSDYPSVDVDMDGRVHVVWQWTSIFGDSKICYRYRDVDRTWSEIYELASGDVKHPFLECYGESVYVHYTLPGSERIMRRARNIYEEIWRWTVVPINPENRPCDWAQSTKGEFTVFQAKNNGDYDIYYWRRNGDHGWLWQYPGVPDQYPSCQLVTTGSTNYLYTFHTHGQKFSPYYIPMFKYRTFALASYPPLYSLDAGKERPSPFLIERDGYIDTWTYPVDIDSSCLQYRLKHLRPDKDYYLKLIAYQESTGVWKERIKLDKRSMGIVKFSAGKPETVELWIPRRLYEEDREVILSIKRLKGAFATLPFGVISEIDREEGFDSESSLSGAMEIEADEVAGVRLLGNLVRNRLQLEVNALEGGMVKMSLYDVTGRIVRRLKKKINCGKHQISISVSDLARGVYFLRTELEGTEQCNKVVVVR